MGESAPAFKPHSWCSGSPELLPGLLHTHIPYGQSPCRAGLGARRSVSLHFPVSLYWLRQDVCLSQTRPGMRKECRRCSLHPGESSAPPGTTKISGPEKQGGLAESHHGCVGTTLRVPLWPVPLWSKQLLWQDADLGPNPGSPTDCVISGSRVHLGTSMSSPVSRGDTPSHQQSTQEACVKGPGPCLHRGDAFWRFAPCEKEAKDSRPDAL